MLIDLMLGLVCLFLTAGVPAFAENSIAFSRAPIIYQQDASETLTAQQNIFTSINYDHDWRANNNWDNLPFYPPKRAVYYSVVETVDDYFIGYYLYYPRHPGATPHEHDMMGIMAAVHKNEDGSSRLDQLLTYNGGQWKSLGRKVVCFNGDHPAIIIGLGSREASTVRPNHHMLHFETAFPLDAENEPSSSTYRLIPLDSLWDHRQDIGKGRAFSQWGRLDSDSRFAVSVPWVWNYRGINWLAKPAELIQRFCGRPAEPVQYINNPYDH